MRKKLECILLIDDDDEDNFYHKIVIERMNITKRIEVAYNGLEALEFLQKESQIIPELIFLDINMPKMNGWEFLEKDSSFFVVCSKRLFINVAPRERRWLARRASAG